MVCHCRRMCLTATRSHWPACCCPPAVAASSAVLPATARPRRAVWTCSTRLPADGVWGDVCRVACDAASRCLRLRHKADRPTHRQHACRLQGCCARQCQTCPQRSPSLAGPQSTSTRRPTASVLSAPVVTARPSPLLPLGQTSSASAARASPSSRATQSRLGQLWRRRPAPHPLHAQHQQLVLQLPCCQRRPQPRRHVLERYHPGPRRRRRRRESGGG